ncbi:hypothetical protein CDD82_6061 [Ophiocordyceps australis]|uniref:tripeptidyl-peptidase II n=1 Tax=Ophiocordyceps australis TaxID=1399860 RepID=A0A2C5YXA2_9HYPO|nr:hypothetical protein CDD82_6061 [Ophiocordyceps australis]
MVSTLLLAALAFARLGAGATCLEKTQVIPQGWKQLDEPITPSQPMQMSFALRQPKMDSLEPLLTKDVRLTRSQVLALREPHKRDVDSVMAWLHGQGIVVAKADKDWVHVSTTVEKAEEMLDMKMHRFSFEGRPAVMRTREYSIPDSLAEAVDFVHPISNFMTPTHEFASLRPMPKAEKRADCSSVTTPECIRRQYNIKSTAGDMSKVRFGVAGFLDEFANYQDTFDFLKRNAPELLPKHYNFSVDLVNNGKNLQDRNRAGSEANLDIQYAMAIGYPTAVKYFSTGGRGVQLNDSGKAVPVEESTNEPYLELLEYLLNLSDDKVPHVLSISYADDELSVPKPYAERVCKLFGALASRGTTVLVGSGDGGAAGGRESSCRTNDGSNKEITMATFPGTCPWLTVVGATDSAHNPPHGAFFSTGGFSQWFPRPEWQDEAVEGYLEALDGHLEGYYDGSKRAIPDISAVGTSFQVVVKNQNVLLDGTSASTPIMAAMIALVNDVRLKKGKPSLGWINKKLYSNQVRSVLRDTTGGQSMSCVFKGGEKPGGWPAKEGWDAITGLGTPGNFKDFVSVLVDMK